MQRYLNVGLILLSLCFGIGTALAAEPEPGCRVAQSWVQEHLSALPQTYEAFSQSPAIFHRAIFNALSPEAKGSLWIARFESYLEAHPGLTNRQINVIHEAMDLASRHETFTLTPKNPLWDLLVGKPLAELSRNSEAEFGREGATRIFAQLTDSEEAAGSLIIAHGLNKSQAICGCNRAHDFCINSTCKPASCAIQQFGCGILFANQCNGLCSF